MNVLEKKRTELELIKVAAARADIEFRIEEALDQIEKYRELVVIQKKKEDELKLKIKSFEQEK